MDDDRSSRADGSKREDDNESYNENIDLDMQADAADRSDPVEGIIGEQKESAAEKEKKKQRLQQKKIQEMLEVRGIDVD